MDKGILKKFAIEARQDLMKMVENQLKMYYVDEEFEKTQTGDLIYLKNSNTSLYFSFLDQSSQEIILS